MTRARLRLRRWFEDVVFPACQAYRLLFIAFDLPLSVFSDISSGTLEVNPLLSSYLPTGLSSPRYILVSTEDFADVDFKLLRFLDRPGAFYLVDTDSLGHTIMYFSMSSDCQYVMYLVPLDVTTEEDRQLNTADAVEAYLLTRNPKPLKIKQ